MTHLLNLLAAIALLVWGTHVVRSGVLRAFGAGLRTALARADGNRALAALSGLLATACLQSSTATCLIVASFAGHGLLRTGAGLATMLGADLGSSIMAAAFSLKLDWLSPLLVFSGVLLHVSREKTRAGHLGRILIGLGLMALAVQSMTAVAHVLTQAAPVQQLLAALPQDVMLDVLCGAALALLCRSSLAAVLLAVTLAGSGILPLGVAFGVVLGANAGSGLLALLATAGASLAARRVPLGNLAVKLAGCAAAMVFMPALQSALQASGGSAHQQVVLFHLAFNGMLACACIGFVTPFGNALDRWLRPAQAVGTQRPDHLDPGALATPALAISCAARQAMHQADLVETMLRGVLPVIRGNDLEVARQLRALDDRVDDLYTAIKFYLMRIPTRALSEGEAERWAEIVSFTIHLEQIGDIVEHVLEDLEEKKIRKNRMFSEAGVGELGMLHAQLLDNLRLSMSVFLHGNVEDARELLHRKARYRALEQTCRMQHLARLRQNAAQSIETSALHLDLISDLRRINSLLCAIAYPRLESAGVLAATRLRAAGEEPPSRTGLAQPAT